MITSPAHPRLLVRWFVQFNPLFTASALCVLGGVLLLSRAMGAGADVALTAVLEGYQWIVIGVAALLYRRLLERRPAAILGVIALVFLADPTLQVSALAGSRHVVVTGLWIACFALKWRALEWAFRLRASFAARVLPPLCAALVALVPNARLLGVGDGVLPVALAAATFGAGVMFAFGRVRVTSERALDEVGALMFPRILVAAAAIGAAGALYQCVNATLAAGPAALLAVLGAAVLVFAAKARSERATWTVGFIGFVLTAAATQQPETALLLAAAALVVSSRDKAPRLLVVAVVAAAVAVHLPVLGARAVAAWTPGLVAADASATAALAYVLLRRRGWSALPALGALHARFLASLGASLVSGAAAQGRVPWGLALVAAGFVLLPAGVALHRRASRVLAADEAARDAGPSSPAAIPAG